MAARVVRQAARATRAAQLALVEAPRSPRRDHAVITDPARLLPAVTVTVAHTWLRCFVLGCRTEAVMSAIHRHFGRVQCCADHPPDRAAIGVGFGSRMLPELAPAAPPVPAAADTPQQVAAEMAAHLAEMAAALTTLLNGPTGDEPDGGSLVPRRPHPPTFDPEGEALALEGSQP